MTVTKTMKMMLLSALLLVGVSGCGGGGGGGGDTGGGVAIFKTVYVGKPQITSANPLLSDLATWGGVEACSTTAFTVVNDTVTVDISVTAASPTITPSPITVNSATITFRAADSLTDKLPELYRVQYIPLGIVIAAGGKASIPIELVSTFMKAYLAEKMVCQVKDRGNYYAEISFDLVENNTNESNTVSNEMLVRFHDFAD